MFSKTTEPILDVLAANTRINGEIGEHTPPELLDEIAESELDWEHMPRKFWPPQNLPKQPDTTPSLN